MARRNSAIADLDIAAEGLAQQDGLAERLARKRATRDPSTPSSEPLHSPSDLKPTEKLRGGAQNAARDANAWRKGKALLQVAIPEDVHVELSIIAKRRRITLSQLVKGAVDQWLEAHGHTLRVE